MGRSPEARYVEAQALLSETRAPRGEYNMKRVFREAQEVGDHLAGAVHVIEGGPIHTIDEVREFLEYGKFQEAHVSLGSLLDGADHYQDSISAAHSMVRDHIERVSRGRHSI